MPNIVIDVVLTVSLAKKCYHGMCHIYFSVEVQQFTDRTSYIHSNCQMFYVTPSTNVHSYSMLCHDIKTVKVTRQLAIPNKGKSSTVYYLNYHKRICLY